MNLCHLRVISIIEKVILINILFLDIETVSKRPGFSALHAMM